MRHARRRGFGFTLIEMLIVLFIITMLLQLILPAVQMAREAARKSQCANQLRQIGLAAQNHESTHGFLPSAGWGWAWVGDPDRGVGKNQPGSWAYQLLPFLDAQSVYDLGRGTEGEEKLNALTTLTSTPVAVFYCPSRRQPGATPNRAVEPYDVLHWRNAKKARMLARMDYAGNLGDQWSGWFQGPKAEKEKIEAFLGDLGKRTKKRKEATGAILRAQPVYFRKITDGLSQTYFAAEKPLVIQQYLTGRNLRDDQSCWNGDSGDTMASTEWPPTVDLGIGMWRRHHKGEHPFGSAHFDGFNAALCDGSVQFVTYDVAPEIHRQFGNRHDENVANNSSP